MSDALEIIYLQRPNLDPDNEWCGNTTWCEEKINDDDTAYVRSDIVDAMRQHVAELEVTAISRLREQVIKDFAQIDRNEAELAALKQSQGEPVAQFRKHGCSDWYDGYPDNDDGGGPYETRTLYTTPTIPKGWQLVPVDPTPEMLSAADGEWIKGCIDPTVHVWDAMLAAAPKPEEQNQLRANIRELPKSGEKG